MTVFTNLACSLTRQSQLGGDCHPRTTRFPPLSTHGTDLASAGQLYECHRGCLQPAHLPDCCYGAVHVHQFCKHVPDRSRWAETQERKPGRLDGTTASCQFMIVEPSFIYTPWKASEPSRVRCRLLKTNTRGTLPHLLICQGVYLILDRVYTVVQ